MLTMANMGRWQTQLCALATLAVLLHQCQVSGRICEPSNRTGPVFFTQVLNVAEYINYGASKALLCCASGFHSIQWHILNATAAWEPYPPDGSGTEQPNTEEDDQVLRIHHAMDFQNTQFRCDLIVNGTVVLSHTVRLYVSHCSTRAKGPILIEPFPQNQTIYDYGGNISLYCTGDFGCYKHNDIQIVRWSVGNNASGFSDRYHLVTNESEDKATLGVTLTIEKVEPIDTTIAFVCTIMNDQFYHGQTDRIVWITKKDRPESPTMMIVMAVCIPVGVFLTTFLVVICVYRCCGPQRKSMNTMCFFTMLMMTVKRQRRSSRSLQKNSTMSLYLLTLMREQSSLSQHQHISIRAQPCIFCIRIICFMIDGHCDFSQP
ncbi:uncharacterized protein LOC127860820 isoform X2 [Dreissena polymorpha]|uniref:uncharacterized protein LOC127860820 isoform X2 n=1 Tax=Dreissena polymorpha TaxID=45954 RepID=UPI0022645A84|nr:uncharacterized protein LOC127860820 isoform X2 [Dreissena polymorpha]